MEREWDFEKYPPRNIIERACAFFQKVVVRPVKWFRETVVEPNRKEYYYYHRQYRRIPTIDQCYEDDWICRWEAEEQYLRDRKIDSHIVALLRQRYSDCVRYEMDQLPEAPKCFYLLEDYFDAAGNWFCKYGDLKFGQMAVDALTKQKHRLIWERRHGPVGTGMREKKYREDGTSYFQ